MLAERVKGIGLLPNQLRNGLNAALQLVFGTRIVTIDSMPASDIAFAIATIFANVGDPHCQVEKADALLHMLGLSMPVRGTMVSLVKSMHLWPRSYALHMLCVTLLSLSMHLTAKNFVSVEMADSIASVIRANAAMFAGAKLTSFISLIDQSRKEVSDAQSHHLHFVPTDLEQNALLVPAESQGSILPELTKFEQATFTDSSPSGALDIASSVCWDNWLISTNEISFDQLCHKLSVWTMLQHPIHDCSLAAEFISAVIQLLIDYPIQSVSRVAGFQLYMSDVMGYIEATGDVNLAHYMSRLESLDALRRMHTFKLIIAAQANNVTIQPNGIRTQHYPDSSVLLDAIAFDSAIYSSYSTDQELQQDTWDLACQISKHLKYVNAGKTSKLDLSLIGENDVKEYNWTFTGYLCNLLDVHPVIVSRVLMILRSSHWSNDTKMPVNGMFSIDEVLSKLFSQQTFISLVSVLTLKLLVSMNTVSLADAVRLGCLRLFSIAKSRGNAGHLFRFLDTLRSEDADWLSGVARKSLITLNVSRHAENIFAAFVAATSSYHRSSVIPARLFSEAEPVVTLNFVTEHLYVSGLPTEVTGILGDLAEKLCHIGDVLPVSTALRIALLAGKLSVYLAYNDTCYGTSKEAAVVMTEKDFDFMVNDVETALSTIATSLQYKSLRGIPLNKKQVLYTVHWLMVSDILGKSNQITMPALNERLVAMQYPTQSIRAICSALQLNATSEIDAIERDALQKAHEYAI